MEVERDENGDLWFRGISPLHADTLMHLPEWLNSDDARVRARLFPPAYEDPEEERQWKQYGVPELEHLFASRTDLVARDLKTLARDGAATYCIKIRRKHATAWLSSLNAARLVLFALHDLGDEDMELDPADLGDFDKELALVRIHLMAYMQEMLIEAGA